MAEGARGRRATSEVTPRRAATPLVRSLGSGHDATDNVSDTPIKKVWIEAGCISCKLCQDIAPQVFLVEDDRDCVVKPDATAHFASRREDIEQAVRDCPVEVIKTNAD